MAVSIQWHDPDTNILRYDIATPWSWEAIFACWQVFGANVRDRTGRIDAIVHLHDVSSAYGADTVKALSQLLELMPAQLNTVVYVGPNIPMWTIIGLLRRYYPDIARLHTHQFADSIEAAIKLIDASRIIDEAP